MEEGALILRAKEIRQQIMRMLFASGTGHSAGPLGMADIYAALYFKVLQHRPAEPAWPERDRLILSCGHTAPVRYAAMAEAGYFPVEELATLRKFGSRLQGHPSLLDLPGLETSSGPLGQGLSQAAGMALAARLDSTAWRTYCILSDGEHEEGQTWEAVQFAGKERLGNLTVVIDRNYIQIDGGTEEVMALGDLGARYVLAGWAVREIDGNAMSEILETFAWAQSIKEQPTCIVAKTVPGKGVSFMERDYHWHGKVPNAKQLAQALEELA